MVLAYKIFFTATDEYQDGRLNPESWVDYGTFGAVIIFIAIMTSALGTHREIPYLQQPKESKLSKRQKFSLRRILDDMLESLSNHNFLIVFTSAIVGAMAGGINSSLVIYFNTYFWEFTASEIGTLNFAYYFSAVTALILAPRLTRGREKQMVAVRVYLVGALLLPLPVVLRMIGFFPSNDSDWLLPLMMVHGYVDVTIMIMASILIGSMIADIVEDSQKSTGRRSEGLFFAGQSFAQKVVHGFGVFATGIILSIIQFPKNVGPSEIPQVVLDNLALIYVPLVICFYSGAVFFLSRYKITRASHAENVKDVEELPS